ncbi:MAG TPA: NAD(P)-dependent alcohol dehydrogenase [Nitrososphaeraceae archaeon]|nr:NAD(P)-dependent alcohol dehydrogenase [Nitrososphaeraceae archaeon]
MNKTTDKNKDANTIRSARIHEYQKPLSIDNTPKPRISAGEQVLVKVAAAGLCHSDLHLINGQWKDIIPIQLPITPGHEVAGWIEELGDSVPRGVLDIGDLVAVFGGWGCGICFHCKNGDEQLCINPKWPGLSSWNDGGYSQYILVPSYRFLINVKNYEKYDIKPEELAPLTDAGLTPYRAIKKIRHLLGPGTNIAIVGVGGLGSYGVQYAKIFGAGSHVIAIDVDDRKLELAERLGADYTINTKMQQDIKKEVLQMTSGNGLNVVVDCVGTEETIRNSVRTLSKGGVLVMVGLFGGQINMPLISAVINEYQVICSLWGNYNELREVIEFAKDQKIKHSIHSFPLTEINKAIDSLRVGNIEGRAVIVP